MGQQWKGSLQGEGQRHALILSRWNHFITDRLMQGAMEALLSLGVRAEAIDSIHVPGAFELGPTALLTAKSGSYDALTCIGCVIRGATAHFEYISGECARLVSQAAYDSGVPVIFGVLTANTIEQAMERAGAMGKAAAKTENKGYEAAQAAVEMANLYHQLKKKG